MKIAIAVLPLLLLPISYAFDCNKVVENIGFCNEVASSNLTDNEKQLLTAEIIHKGDMYPDHNFVYDWNTKIEFIKAPSGVETTSNGFIKDAWLKIITVMPSVMDSVLLNNGSGVVLTAFNYNLDILPDYNSPGYPDTDDGDCKREYDANYNNWLNLYLNEKLLGTKKLLPFEAKEDMHFKAELKIQAHVDIRHYHWHSWCCSRNSRGRCVGYCDECEFSYTETRQDEVNLEDSFYAKYYSTNINPKFKITNQYYGTTTGILNASNYSSIKLSFDNSYFEHFNYYYNLNLSYAPYDVLTLNANKHENIESENINVRKTNNTFKFSVKNINGCEISFWNHFLHQYGPNCDLSYIPINLSIDTDKLTYFENESIKIELSPKNKDMEVRYGANKIITKNNVEFTAAYSGNRVKVILGDHEADKVIYIKKKENHVLLYNLGTFSGICYLFYCFLKKYLYFM